MALRQGQRIARRGEEKSSEQRQGRIVKRTAITFEHSDGHDTIYRLETLRHNDRIHALNLQFRSRLTFVFQDTEHVQRGL